MSDELVNDPRPLLPQGRWFKVLVVLTVLVAVVVYGWRAAPWRSPSEAEQAAGPPAATATPSARHHLTAGLFIEGRRPDYTVRYQSTAHADLHVLVLRDRRRGSFGHRAAVILFPFPDTGGRRDRSPRRNEVEATINDSRALVRGDLPRAQLQRIAEAVTVDGSHPIVGDLPGLRTASAGTYGGCELLESWYRSEDLGFDRWFGDGYVYTVITDCGGFEDALLAAGATVGPNVYARPSAVSRVLGGDATLSWELAPGLIGVVGYRGKPRSPERIDILTSIAKETRTYGADQWDDTQPFTQLADPLEAWLP